MTRGSIMPCGCGPVPVRIRKVEAPVAMNPFSFFNDLVGALDAGSCGCGSFKVDIKETDDGYQVVADVPGIDKADIDVKLDEDVLTVSYEVKEEKDEKDDDGKWVVRERSYSSAKKTFTLPDADEDATSATMEDGVLTITVPKKVQQEAPSKTIEIS